MQENNEGESRRNSVMEVPAENKELNAYLNGTNNQSSNARKDKLKLFAKKFNLD
jgi:hypothetical protein